MFQASQIASYEPLWLALALLFLVAAVFVAICRRALENYSRKALLLPLGPHQHKAFEEMLGDDDDYVDTLERIEFFLRALFLFALVAGRLIAVDRWLAETPSAPAATLSALNGGQLLGVLGILFLEMLLAVVVALVVVPTIIGEAWPEAWLRRFLGLVDRIHRLCHPIRRLFKRVGRLASFLRPVSAPTSADMVEEELRSAAEEGGREGVLDSTDIDMIESIISFGDVEALEVMTPRTEMVCLDLDDPLEENLRLAIECGHSRIPVYADSKDNVRGVLYVKDLLRSLYLKEEIDLRALARKPYRVHRAKKIDEILQEFKQHRLHIAIVVDDHDGTDGLVTIEDILEEIVGEISDEYEKVEPLPLQRISESLVDVDAGIHIDDLNDELGLEIPESENYDTIGGFVFASMGRVPETGDTFVHAGVEFRVTASDERRILKLRVYLPAEKGATEDVSP